MPRVKNTPRRNAGRMVGRTGLSAAPSMLSPGNTVVEDVDAFPAEEPHEARPRHYCAPEEFAIKRYIFLGVVRDAAADLEMADTTLRFKKTAIDALQVAAEGHLANSFETAATDARRCGRKVVTPADFLSATKRC